MTASFSEDFLQRYPAFRGELSPGDQRIGEQWFAVWTNAQESAAEALQLRAAAERKAGRVEVADALEAASTSLDVIDQAAY